MQDEGEGGPGHGGAKPGLLDVAGEQDAADAVGGVAVAVMLHGVVVAVSVQDGDAEGLEYGAAEGD